MFFLSLLRVIIVASCLGFTNFYSTCGLVVAMPAVAAQSPTDLMLYQLPCFIILAIFLSGLPSPSKFGNEESGRIKFGIWLLVFSLSMILAFIVSSSDGGELGRSVLEHREWNPIFRRFWNLLPA